MSNSSGSRRPSSGAGARRPPSLSSASSNPLSGQDEMALSFAGEPSFSPFSTRSSSSRRSSRGASQRISGDAESEYHPIMVPSARRAAPSPNGARNEAVTRRPPPSAQTATAGRTAVAPPDEHTERGENELFFDAGDALAGGEDESAQPVGPPPPSGGHPLTNPSSAQAGTGEGLPSYDFERQTYFSLNAVQPSSSSGGSPSAAANQRRRSTSLGNTGANEASSSTTNLQSFGNSPNPLDDPSADGQGSTVSRARMILGRFGRFVGMRVPGATYNTLSQNDQDGPGANGAGGAQQRRRVMGGGLGQDGVFGNISAKPDRRRRRRQEGDEVNQTDRGDDDDLVSGLCYVQCSVHD